MGNRIVCKKHPSLNDSVNNMFFHFFNTLAKLDITRRPDSILFIIFNVLTYFLLNQEAWMGHIEGLISFVDIIININ